jgi:Alcohol dehydrogenase GroES-like domain
LVRRCKAWVRCFTEPTADGEVLRVARRFALLAEAGKLAIEFGVLPWLLTHVDWAVKEVFFAWTRARASGETGSTEALPLLAACASSSFDTAPRASSGWSTSPTLPGTAAAHSADAPGSRRRWRNVLPLFRPTAIFGDKAGRGFGMKALVLREHGAGGLSYESDFPDPAPGAGDVVVRVRATALNYHDVYTCRGMPGIRIAMPAIMGLDVAGEIAAIGPGVIGWGLGDRVLGDPINRVEGGLVGETVHGGLAEYCRLRAHQLVAIPDGVDFAQERLGHSPFIELLNLTVLKADATGQRLVVRATMRPEFERGRARGQCMAVRSRRSSTRSAITRW